MATSSLSVVPPMLQLDPKHQASMRSLISTVIRSFYEPKFYILMELLAKHHIFRDDELAGRVGLNVKDLNRLMAILTNHRLVQAYRQNEMKENQGRIVGKAYFYIDPQKFCNVIKWRISDMRNQIDNSLKAELDNKGYICPLCTKSFTALEVDQVFDFTRNILACDVCGTELVDNENSEKVKGSKDRMQRFNAQMKYIRDGLRNIEGVVMPAFDVARYVREKMAAEKSMGVMDDDGLKVATGAGKAQQVEIHMVEDEDEEQKRKERQKTADEKRRQNAMPSWHTNSTISGEKTALGIKADERSTNEALLAAAEAQAKALEAKAASYDTFDTEEYYDNLINGGEDSPRGMKRKLEEEHDDGRQMKMARREDGQPVWGPPGGGYPGMLPGMPYGYPPHMMPIGQQRGGPGGPGGHPMYPHMAGAANQYRNSNTALPFTSQSSIGTSRNTPSANSDSDSSLEPQREAEAPGGGPSGSSTYAMANKKKKPSLNGLEKRVSFAEVVSERSPSPPPASDAMDVTPQKSTTSAELYNPIVKVGGKDVLARDVKEGDDELMTADEFEAYWLIKEKIDELDAA